MVTVLLQVFYYNVTLYSGAQNHFELPFATNDLTADGGQYYLNVPHNLGKFPSITVKISTRCCCRSTNNTYKQK